MINILHVVSGSTEAGGVEEMIFLLCKHLDHSRFSHSVWAPFGAGDYLERSKSEGLIKSFSETSYPDELLHYFRSNRFDIALVHSGALNPLFACHQIGALRTFDNLPIVEVLHRAIRTWAGPYRAERIIAVSDFVASLQPPPYDKLVESIPNGIDLRPYQSFDQAQSLCRRSFNIPEDSAVVGFLGRLTDEKCPLDVLKAAPAIASSIENACFVFGGDGPLKQVLEQKAEQLGVNALFTGAIRPEQKVAFLRSMDLLMLTSRTEAFCLVALESLSAGTPLVSYGLEAVQEFFRDMADTFFLVPPGDADSLSNAAIRLLGDDEVRRQLAERCLEIAGNYSIQRVVKEYERVLLSISKSQKASPVWEIRPPLYRSLGSVCLVKNDRDKAQKWFNEAVRQDPSLGKVIAHDIAQYNACVSEFLADGNSR